MNFPVGQVIAKSALPVNFQTIVSELTKISFNGYLIQTVRGKCVEEGVLFFREGTLNACIVECLALNKILKGDEAIDYFLNQTRGNGFFQTVQLTRSQVDLVTAFDEKLLLANKINLKDLPKLIPSSFEPKFNIEESKSNLLEEYGLSELRK